MGNVGYDCANEIQNVYGAAYDEFGADPAFWLRYFGPSPAADLFNDDPLSESEGAWDSGGNYVGCISAPSQGNLSGSSATGLADAQTFAASMLSAYYAVGPIYLPSNNKLYCWLDQEYGTSLSLSYLDGWANYIANYNFAGLDTYPLYPCVYCTPSAPYPNCSTFAAASGLNVPAAVWCPVPEYCDSLTAPPGVWEAESCSSYSSSKVPTELWQFAEQGVCDLSAPVDLDQGHSGFTVADYCFEIAYNPS
jgi:hypothetical protein